MEVYRKIYTKKNNKIRKKIIIKLTDTSQVNGQDMYTRNRTIITITFFISNMYGPH